MKDDYPKSVSDPRAMTTAPEETFTDSIGWNYRDEVPEGDQRKLVYLEQDGMCWIGIRVWQSVGRRWINNNEPERARVLCWMDLPESPLRWWERGKLTPEIDVVHRQLRGSLPYKAKP